jgi:IS30 family transposase
MGQINHTTGKRRWKQLSEVERYKIEALLEARHTPSQIAKQLGRDRRTIEREVNRGMVMQRDHHWRDRCVYKADVGQRVFEGNAANKGRPHKIGSDHKLAIHIERRIVDDKYSPGAVIGEIKTKGLQFEVALCTKTLYNMIDSGFFLRLSNKDLPVKRAGKKRQYRSVRKVALKNTKGRSIEERPPEVETRKERGHWEMDCVVGAGKPCLLVLTERSTREQIIVKMGAKTQANVKAALDSLERKHRGRFKGKFKSITMDNGPEFLDMCTIERSALYPGEKRTTCYYAHPYSAWERGSNENNNRLIRRFIPKGSDIGKLSHEDVKRVERWINNYPRRIFGYKSSKQMAA